MIDLDGQLLAAHARNDAAALVRLYQEAATAATDQTARAFYLTHAYVFALEIAHPDTDDLREVLARMGCEPVS